MHLDYLDFVITVDGQPPAPYTVKVRSPVGEAQATLSGSLLSLSEPDSPFHDTHHAQTIGHALFTALFPDEVRSLYYESRREAEHRSCGLRIKLILPPPLALLPWELLYDARDGEYIALSHHTPIVRYLEVAQPGRSLAVVPPLHVLGVAVSPTDLAVLDLAAEAQRLDAALAPLHGTVEVTWLHPPITWQTLLQTMRQQTWHVLHFVGHGMFDELRGEGVLFFTDPDGRAQPISATQFARLIADHRTLRLVLLNACEGAGTDGTDHFAGTAATLIRRGSPAVIAMQGAVSDTAAIEFCAAFYSALADGTPVDTAVAEARKAVSFALIDSLEWATPILYMRSPDGNIFALEVESAESQDAETGTDQTRRSTQESQEKPQGATFQNNLDRSEVGEIINVNTLQGGLTINKNK